jgi:hypothetical protein
VLASVDQTEARWLVNAQASGQSRTYIGPGQVQRLVRPFSLSGRALAHLFRERFFEEFRGLL